MAVRPYQSDAVEQTAAPHPKSVMLIDNHPVVGLGIELAFRNCLGLSLVRKISNPAAAISAIEECTPDAIVLDVVFNGAVYFPLIQKARAAMPSVLIVVFSSLPAELYKQAALDAGADFYLTKDNDCDHLIGVLTASFAKPLSRNATPAGKPIAGRRSIGPPSPAYEARLTPREHEIASLLSQGLSVADIAHLVQASKKTVCVHRDNLRIKLRCRDSTELVARLAWSYARRKQDANTSLFGSPSAASTTEIASG